MSWAVVLALLSVDPEVATQRSDLTLLQMALPEVNEAQPRGIYREVILRFPKLIRMHMQAHTCMLMKLLRALLIGNWVSFCYFLCLQ